MGNISKEGVIRFANKEFYPKLIKAGLVLFKQVEEFVDPWCGRA